MRVGYAMISFGEQPIDIQTEALAGAGCDRIYTDILDGDTTQKTGLDDALAFLQSGDVFIVWRLDRLGRSQRQIIDIIALLQKKQSSFISLTEKFDVNAANDGSVVVQNIGALAEMPRNRVSKKAIAAPQKRQSIGHSILFGGLAVLSIIILYFVAFSLPSYDAYTGRVLQAHVNGIDTATAVVDETVTVMITSGDLHGKVRTMDYRYNTILKNNEAAVGDPVLLGYDTKTQQIFINGFDRRGYTFLLMLIFLSLTMLIARRQGFMSLLGMLVSILVVLQFVVPAIYHGNDPLFAAILSALVIIPITYYLAHGWNGKTTVAIISTFATLTFIALLAYVFTHLMKIPDALSDESMRGYYTDQGTLVNLQSFYLAALVISALAVLNDITISQASIVTSLVQSNPSLTFREIIAHAMDVGKDHIASLINTLLLVYIGAALPQFLTFIEYNYDFSNPLVSVEIVRIIIPSIGIVMAVPIATIIAAYFTTHKQVLGISRKIGQSR